MPIIHDTHSSSDHAPFSHSDEPAVILGENVTRLRKQAKLTKQKFALMIDVGRPFLNRVEQGTADVRLSVLVRMAEALETTPEALLSSPVITAEPESSGTQHARLR